MKKLSEISNDTMLTIEQKDGDIDVMEKSEFLQDERYLSINPSDKATYPVITIGNRETARFDWNNVLESIGDEMYDDWLSDVVYEIVGNLQLKNVEKTVNDIFEKHPTYYEGEPIEIDVFKEQQSEGGQAHG